MNDRIYLVAHIIADKTSRLGDSTMSGFDRAFLAARTLAEAGMLAPAMREEWATADSQGDADTCCGYDARESVEEDDRPIVRRYVTDWEQVDCHVDQ